MCSLPEDMSPTTNSATPTLGMAKVHLHLDYARPLLGHMFFNLVDAPSKWMEVKIVRIATSTTTLEHLRNIFATHGLP